MQENCAEMELLEASNGLCSCEYSDTDGSDLNSPVRPETSSSLWSQIAQLQPNH